MKNRKLWPGLLILATIILIGLSACQPAELSVEPTLEAAAEAEADIETQAEEVEGETGVFDLVYPPAGEVDMEGAITTESGLQYLEILAGQGPKPQDGDIVQMHFIALLPDGTEFSNSYAEGTPVEAIMGRDQLLPSWEEGVKLMTAGGQARMLLPPDLAFGDQGYGMIPPDPDVILMVEVISIEAPPQPESFSSSDLTTTDSGLQYFDIVVGEGENTLVEIVRRFDHRSNDGVSEVERWGIPDILRAERRDYATLDQAVMATAMTETVRILDEHFSTPWAEDPEIKPLLMYAQEAQSRSIGMSSLFVS